jgi:hypothetical protein
MTKILHRDSDRCCKPLEEWPTADRDSWRAALIPGDLFVDGGSRARHSEYSNRNAVWGYDRWLTFLDRDGLLDTTTPADRITRARVNAYLADLEQHNSTQTLLNRLQELRAMAVVIGRIGIGAGSTTCISRSGHGIGRRAPNARGWRRRARCSISGAT